MKKIAVCGDSYLTPVIDPAGTHFSELIAQELGAELLYFSRAGMSNGGICLQLRDAIQQQPDLILFNVAVCDRIEFPIAETQEEFHSNNIYYSHSLAVSSTFPERNKHATMVSDTLNSLLSNPNDPKEWHMPYTNVPGIDHKIGAVREYFLHLYDKNWKTQIDRWCMYSMTHQLETSGIPYIIVLDQIDTTYFPWINERNHITSKISPYYYAYYDKDPDFIFNGADPGYHTPPEVQVEISEEIMQHLKEWKFINE